MSDAIPKAAPDAESDRRLSPEARRALAEAEARRTEIDARAAALTKAPERNGRGGLDPVRYEDWEVSGRAVDF
jgi:hypothetical protein